MATQTLDGIKKDLIFQIQHLEDEESLRRVAEVVNHLEKRPTAKQSEMLRKLTKPMREKIDLEALKREQNWKPTSREEIDEIIKGFDWQISDEEFLKILEDD